MNARERWALTFLLETYVDVSKADSYDLFSYDGSFSDITIGFAISLILKKTTITVEELSRELKEVYGVKIHPILLKRYSNQQFDKYFVMVNTKKHTEGGD